MMVIGVDTHKSSHAMAGVAADTGLLTSEREIAASDDGHRAALAWARALDPERVWAIEDCRHVSRRLEQALITAGERVIRVPAENDGAVTAFRARVRQVRSDRCKGRRQSGTKGGRGALPCRVPGRARTGD